MNNMTFLNDVPAALAQFPKLHVEERDGISILLGEIDLIQGECLEDSYLIEVHQTDKYPARFPKVFEVGGRIPNNVDWHVMTDGSLCIAAPPDEILACAGGITLYKYLKLWVIPYLYNQTFRKRNGYFYKERSHGDLGIIESYQEILGIRSIGKIIEALNYVGSHKEPDRTSLCFCGSGKKFRKCHRDQFRTLKKIDDVMLLHHAFKFSKLLERAREMSKNKS